jgi:hypothetical protein
MEAYMVSIHGDLVSIPRWQELDSFQRISGDLLMNFHSLRFPRYRRLSMWGKLLTTLPRNHGNDVFFFRELHGLLSQRNPNVKVSTSAAIDGSASFRLISLGAHEKRKQV